MDRDEALDRLPSPYAVALRGTDKGLDPRELADLLGIEPEALPSLLTVARAKLRSLVEAPSVPHPEPGES